MNRFWHAAFVVAGIAVSTAAAAEDARRPISLTSFGAAQSLSAYQLSTTGMMALDAPGTYAASEYSRAPLSLSINHSLPSRESFAASVALSSSFALDSGYNADIAQRFLNYDASKSPLLDTGSALSLANGGTYAGATWMPATALHVRVGAAMRSERMDGFSFDPISRGNGLPLTFGASQSNSLLAGISWDVSDWGGFSMTGIQNNQFGTPFGINPLGNLSSTSRVNTSALDVAAHLKLGNGWVTTASYSEGLSQLDQRAAAPRPQGAQSYSIAIAKHGLFSNDALGFSLSQPLPGVLENGFDMVAASGDLPPMFLASGRFPGQKPETDLQLGYVTSFLDGALALQTNASYQMNYQGQTGATSLSVLSRAKIKF